MVLIHLTEQLMRLLIVVFFCCCAFRVHGEVNYLLFPEIKLVHQEGKSFSEKNITPAVDFFVSGQLGDVIVLAEVFASEQIQHIERLQLGLKFDSSRIWLGRHHNPFGYWHTQYHHGAYLQTSVSRPGLVNFGGAGGLVPSHTTGGLFEGNIDQGRTSWQYAFSAGYTSQLDPSGGGHHGDSALASLNDFDLSNPKPSEHQIAYTFRVAYLSDALEENIIGSFVSRANITVAQREDHQMSIAEDINLDIFGLFTNYQQEKLRIIAEWYYFSSEVLNHTNVQQGRFSAAYFQAEYQLNQSWTPYIRLETTFSDENDPYLALLNGYAADSQVAGIRFDVTDNQTIKFEYAKKEFIQTESEYWQLSWSAVWP